MVGNNSKISVLRALMHLSKKKKKAVKYQVAFEMYYLTSMKEGSVKDSEKKTECIQLYINIRL